MIEFGARIIGEGILLATKFLLSYLKERLFKKACYGFFISCLILKIFSLKAMNCQPSWIIEDMHVTSQVV